MKYLIWAFGVLFFAGCTCCCPQPYSPCGPGYASGGAYQAPALPPGAVPQQPYIVTPGTVTGP